VGYGGWRVGFVEDEEGDFGGLGFEDLGGVGEEGEGVWWVLD